jgi:two-component system cell cycle response regulator
LIHPFIQGDYKLNTKLPKILVVDDEVMNLEIMEGYLSNDYEIALATSGKETLSKVKQFQPDVILLDILMPSMDGFQTCKILKDGEDTKFIPIILVTALSSKEDRIKGIEAGADEFLTKPVNPLELKSRIRSLLKLKHQHDLLLEDITLRKKIEQNLKKTNEHLDLLIEMSPIATIIIGKDDRILKVNKSAVELLGFETEDILSTSLSKLICGNQNLNFSDKNDFSVEFLKKNGHSIELNVSTSIITNNDHEKEMIINLQNISELRGLLIDPSLEKPSLEKGSETRDYPSVEMGYTYIHHEDYNMGAYDIFSKIVKGGHPGLCITRENPANIRRRYNLSKTPIVWLTKNKKLESPSLDPSEIFKLHPTVESFIKKVHDGIVLIDGIEYLILENDFKSVLKFIEQMNDSIMISDSILIFNIDSKVFDTKEYHLLKRWMKPLEQNI